MKLVPLALLTSASLLSAGGEDSSPHAPYPSPRHSGLGRVEFTSSNVQLLGWKTLADFAGGNTSGNDVWGYTSPSGREYAIIGLSDGTGFVEVTDPGNATVIDFKSGVNSLWRGIKTYSTFAYVVSEGGGGIQVFNLGSIDSGVVTLANTISTGGCTTATHTLAIDETSGFLYRAGGSSTPCAGGTPQGLVIYSLANPSNPTLVGTWNTRYVHECQVLTWDVAGPFLGQQLAFCFTEDTSGGGNARLQILNVTNKASITQVSSTAYAGSAFSHQGWVTPDRQYLYLNDELDDGSFGGARTRVFSLANLNAPVSLGAFPTGIVVPSIDHNLYIKGNRIYESNYRSGLRIFDRSGGATTNPTVAGFFDTYPEDDAQDFNSLWSNYPFFASGTILGGDIEKGLWIWREGAAKLLFDFPGGAPQFIGPGGGVVQFTVDETAPGNLVAGTVKFHYSTGGAFTAVNATQLGGNLYQAVMPSVTCGSALDYYLSAKSTGNVTWTDPPAAPTQVNQAIAAYGETVAHFDDFEANSGWQVNVAADLGGNPAASTGTWVRANPVGTSAQPEDDHTPAPGTLCFVTANGAVGGGLGDADVDNGATSLRSPTLDASGMADPYLSYWRWYSNNQNGVVDDTMVIDISNNNGSSWVNLETLGPAGNDSVGGWIHHSVRIASKVAPTSTMRVRFRVSDLGSGSIVEAALDDLAITEYDCTPPNVTVTSVSPNTGSFDGGEIVTITGLGFTASSSVSFGTSVATAVNFVNATTLQVRVPRDNGAQSGKAGRVSQVVDVTVSNPGSDTLVDGYTYQLKQKNF